MRNSSIRHAFKDSTRLAVVPEDVAESIMGHGDPKHALSRGYGEAQVAVLAQWMPKIDPLDPMRTSLAVDY